MVESWPRCVTGMLSHNGPKSAMGREADLVSPPKVKQSLQLRLASERARA